MGLGLVAAQTRKDSAARRLLIWYVFFTRPSFSCQKFPRAYKLWGRVVNFLRSSGHPHDRFSRPAPTAGTPAWLRFADSPVSLSASPCDTNGDIVLPVVGSHLDSGILWVFMRVLRAGAVLPGLMAGMSGLALAQTAMSGLVTDPQGNAVAGAAVKLVFPKGSAVAETRTDSAGQYSFRKVAAGEYRLIATAPGFAEVSKFVSAPQGQTADADLQFEKVEAHSDSVVITARSIDPAIDMRNGEVFNRTLFTRDDQVFQQLNAGISAGQHEGGGKSLEIRRFGFNLDHGGVNGGLKVLVDDVQQNQGSQGHGQGYLGSLKALSPELIQEVNIINGPFSAQYGDFSGLGVVHIRQRESLPDQFMARLEGGNFDTGRAFLAYRPEVQTVDSYVAYEGSYTDGPFINPGRYRRDNVNANYTRPLDDKQKLGFRFIFGRNDFYSSGQIPLDLVAAGLLDRFGYVDPSDGGRVKLGTFSSYYSKSFNNGDTFKVDGFIGRSLFDLYSNFTYFLKDPVHGDAFQQHDSRLQEGSNAQYAHPHKVGSIAA